LTCQANQLVFIKVKFIAPESQGGIPGTIGSISVFCEDSRYCKCGELIAVGIERTGPRKLHAKNNLCNRRNLCFKASGCGGGVLWALRVLDLLPN
jgi:hypothetical protein